MKFLHVPYKGVAPAYQDLVAGRLQFMYTDLASVLPYVTRGRSSHSPWIGSTPLLPDAPTLADAGLPAFDAPTSFSVMVPAGTPAPIVARLSSAVASAMR